MRRRGLGCLVLLGALLRGTCPAPARADDLPGVVAASSGASPELRLYPVRSLLRGHPVYQGDRGPFPVAPEEVNDEAQPLFGGEFGDRTYGFGWPDEVVSTIRAEVTEPGASAEGNVSIDLLHVAEGLTGDGYLTVRAPGAQQARVAAWLDRSSREALRTVVLDVVAFRGDAAVARLEGGVAAAVARRAWVPLGALRMTMHPSGGAVGRVGALRAYLQDDDVEVAIDASSTVAIVGVAPEGLAVEAASVPAEGDRVSVHAARVVGVAGRVGRVPPRAGRSHRGTRDGGEFLRRDSPFERRRLGAPAGLGLRPVRGAGPRGGSPALLCPPRGRAAVEFRPCARGGSSRVEDLPRGRPALPGRVEPRMDRPARADELHAARAARCPAPGPAVPR